MSTHNDVNSNIGCTVADCKFHAESEQYCTLNKIQVVNHTKPAVTKENTDCGSFESKR